MYALCILLAVFLRTGLADNWPSNGGFYDICLEIYNDLANDAVKFRSLKETCTTWLYGCSTSLVVTRTLTRAQLCDALTDKHDTYSAGFLGASVSPLDCTNALLHPRAYTKTTEWNAWEGRHCGTWFSDERNSSFVDNALWSSGGWMNTFLRQNVHFMSRKGQCQSCLDGWRESGGGEVIVWGWEPCDDLDHRGYQGSRAGYPFSPAGSKNTKCIVWVSGVDADLECVVNGKKRTKVSFSGYGQWNIKPTTKSC